MKSKRVKKLFLKNMAPIAHAWRTCVLIARVFYRLCICVLLCWWCKLILFRLLLEHIDRENHIGIVETKKKKRSRTMPCYLRVLVKKKNYKNSRVENNYNCYEERTQCGTDGNDSRKYRRRFYVHVLRIFQRTYYEWVTDSFNGYFTLNVSQKLKSVSKLKMFETETFVKL